MELKGKKKVEREREEESRGEEWWYETKKPAMNSAQTDEKGGEGNH